MAPVEALPKGLQAKWFEKYQPANNTIPPLRFVPDNIAYTGRGPSKPDKAKIDSSREVKKEYIVLKDGKFEDVLLLIDTHKGLVKSKQFAERLLANTQLLSQKVSEYNKVKSSKGRDDRRIEPLQEAISELKATRTDLQNSLFDLFGELVDEVLKPKWEVVVEEQIEGSYVDLEGKRQARAA